MAQLWRTSLFGIYDKLCSHSPTATRDLTRPSAQLTIASEEKTYSKLYNPPSSAIQPCPRSASLNLTNLMRFIVPAHEPQRVSSGQASELASKVTSAFHQRDPSRKSRAPFHRTAAAMQFVFTFSHPSYTPTAQSPSSSIVTVLRYKFCTVPTVYSTFLLSSSLQPHAEVPCPVPCSGPSMTLLLFGASHASRAASGGIRYFGPRRNENQELSKAALSPSSPSSWAWLGR
jgi:hypothetical protein